jgi:hypothetical protein
MGRHINSADQLNLWGRASDDDGVYEPQRTDLFMVDLTGASRKLAGLLSTKDSVDLTPQFVQSVTFPEQKVRPEMFRRDSVAFNMPTWDEPLDPIKITFLVSAMEDDLLHPVLYFLEWWHLLARRGMGSKAHLYESVVSSKTEIGYVSLDGDYRMNCRFDFMIQLLRGGDSQAMLNAMRRQRDQLVATTPGKTSQNGVLYSKATPSGDPSSPYRLDVGLAANVSNRAEMSAAMQWMVKGAWIGGYKLSDLSYTRSELLTCEASFYPEAIYRI